LKRWLVFRVTLLPIKRHDRITVVFILNQV
jgi:hypothetical protein